MEHNCLHEERWGKVLTQLEYISSKVCSHIKEGEERGGYRDRLIVIEQEVNSLKRAEWTRVVFAGVIGGLIGKLTPDLINFLIKCVFAGN